MSSARAAALQTLSPAMTESDLDRGIRRILADLPALRWYHTHDSRRSPHGFPDLVVVGPRAVIWRELKRENGRHTAAQLGWLFALSDAGQDAATWRPAQLLDGTIARELAALAGMGGSR